MPGSRMFSPQCGTGMQGVYAAARIISRTARLPQPSSPQGTSGAELLLPQAAASPCETLQPAEPLGVRLSEAQGAIGAWACGQGPCGAASQEPSDRPRISARADSLRA